MKAIKMTFSEFLTQVSRLMRDYDVVAPVRSGDRLDYAPVTDVGQIVLNDELPYKSAKETVFPQVEELMRFTAEGVTAAVIERPTLLLGAKPCDLEAFKVLDAVFTGDRAAYRDRFYRQRRESVVTVGMGCETKKRACFCDQRGVDMSWSDECDAFLVLDGEDVTLNLLTERGEGLFTGAEAAPTEHGERREAALTIEQGENELFTAMPWEDYAVGCLGCGTCTFVCPTCHCFDWRDAERDGECSRCRVWDSCMLPGFTLQAGGGNPRSTRPARLRQRVLHKYVYVRENFGVTACTGCGRCIRLCPGGLNIREIVEDVNERAGEGK